MGGSWVFGASVLREAHTGSGKEDTQVESTDGHGNGLGIREPVQAESMGPKTKNGWAKIAWCWSRFQSRNQGGGRRQERPSLQEMPHWPQRELSDRGSETMLWSHGLGGLLLPCAHGLPKWSSMCCCVLGFLEAWYFQVSEHCLIAKVMLLLLKFKLQYWSI